MALQAAPHGVPVLPRHRMLVNLSLDRWQMALAVELPYKPWNVLQCWWMEAFPTHWRQEQAVCIPPAYAGQPVCTAASLLSG